MLCKVDFPESSINININFEMSKKPGPEKAQVKVRFLHVKEMAASVIISLPFQNWYLTRDFPQF